jgi:Tol biopolymer transport system component
MVARRRAREVPDALPDRPAPTTGEPEAEVLRALEEEVGALPDHLRVAVVLCELDGLGRTDAAARLGIPPGTLSSRLAKARQILAARLRKRGVALSTTALVWALGQLASAAVPPQLASATTALVSGSVPVPVQVAALTQGVFRTMFLTKLTVLAGLFLAIAVWAGFPGGSAAVADPPAPRVAAVRVPAQPDEKKPPPAAKPAGPGTLLLARESDLVTLTPEGKEGTELAPAKDSSSTHQGRLSPDVTRVAFVVNKGKPRGPNDDLDAPWPFQVVIRKPGATEEVVADFSVKGLLTICWAPDGKKVLVTNDREGKGELETTLIDAGTGKTEPIDLPVGVRVLDWSRDGRTFLVVYRKDKKLRLGLLARSNKEVQELTELKFRLDFGPVARFSPDEKKVLFTDADPEQKDAYKWHRSSRPHVLDVATKKRQPLAEFPENASCIGLAWSPDGKRVAYTWTQLHPDLLKKDTIDASEEKVTEAFLVVTDADGKNAKTVASGKVGNSCNTIFGSIDWR